MSQDVIQDSSTPLKLRAPEKVVTLKRLGSFFPSRLSFIPQLIRRIVAENWHFHQPDWHIDDAGVGHAVYTVNTQDRAYSLVAFAHQISPEERTDRVIATVWDATFNLFDGVPTAEDIQRLSENTPKQEAGRFSTRELVLARANKSVRLFEGVSALLAKGEQPPVTMLAEVGYLMRTSAVYGSGKFGCADREHIADRPEMQCAFQAEMLAVYLIRQFSIDLLNHAAKVKGGDQAVMLEAKRCQCLGIGNSTGLGMSPFLVKHRPLVHQWVYCREMAIARVCALADDAGKRTTFEKFLKRGIEHIADWHVYDPEQSQRNQATLHELTLLSNKLPKLFARLYPWQNIMDYVGDHCSEDTQEFIASMLIEPFGDLIDDLGPEMYTKRDPALNATQPIGEMRQFISDYYGWALAINFDDPKEQQHFWYYSENKLEPRFGNRLQEDGSENEMPLMIAKDVKTVFQLLQNHADDRPIAEFLLQYPQYRHICLRIQHITEFHYGEIQHNLIASDVRPLDILRLKLSFFGVMKYDPKSDLWLRVNMYAGVPLAKQLNEGDARDIWAYPLWSDAEAHA